MTIALRIGPVDHVQKEIGGSHLLERRAKCRHERMRQPLDEPDRVRDQQLAAVATRLAWTVGALLLAIVFTWAVIELSVIRRITLLTKRAAAVSVVILVITFAVLLGIGGLRRWATRHDRA